MADDARPGTQSTEDDPQEARRHRRRRWWIWGGVGVAALAVCVGGYFYWMHEKHHPSTDDAYIKAQVVHVAPQVSGKVADLPIHDQQHVASGALLLRIDPAPYLAKVRAAEAAVAIAREGAEGGQSAVAAAEAALADRKAAADQAEKHFQRIATLVRRGTAARAELDSARAARDQARAAVDQAQANLKKAREEQGKGGAANDRVQQAEAQLAIARIQLAHTELHAACAGRISGAASLHPGDWLAPGDPGFVIVCDGKRWVYANYQETDLVRIRPGQVATVSIDMYPDRTFHGIVEAIGPASGAAFSLLPPENATGNWVKVTQRVPVRILVVDAGGDYPLRVQTSAEVSVDTGSDSTPAGLARRASLTDDEAMARARKLGVATGAEAASNSQ